MFSKKTVLALFAMVVVLSMIAAQCGAPATPQTIVEKVVETVVVEKEGETIVETVVVEVERTVEVEKVVEKVVEKEVVVEVGALPEAETLVTSFGYNDVPTLDPSLAEDTSAIQMGVELFPGLTRIHEETGDVQPGMATDWTVSDDGLVYTFNIRDDISWVKFNNVTGEVEQVLDDEGNPRIVNCNDFLYGIRRTLDPNTGGSYAYVNWVIENAGAVNGENGEDDPLFGQTDQIGVQCLDDFTLEYTLREAAAFFPSIAHMWINWAQPQWLIEEMGDRWVEGGIVQSYGPYALFDWTHDASITMIANPFWPGTDSIPVPTIKYVHSLFLDDPEAFANYEADLMDVSNVPQAEIERVKADPTLSEELNIYPDTCTYYYGFNTSKAPFDDVNVRKAFSWAIDRQALIDNVTKGEQEPARWFARPGLTAAPNPAAGDDFGPPPTADVEAAQEFLAASSYGSADALPEITLMHNESAGHARIAEAIQQMWNENLGANVNIATQEWGVYLETLEQDSPQVWRLGWCDDYPDASNFDKDVFRSDSGNNHTWWGNDEFDALVDEAARVTDPEQRKELYAQAEQILVDQDAAIIPIYWYTGVEVTKPYVNRTFGRGGQNYYEKWTMDKPE
jgi:oligopeptide transport system substrate-binding protein